MPSVERIPTAALGAALGAAMVTLASIAVFRFLYRNCVEMECFGIFLFVPAAAIGAGLVGLVSGSYARAGCRGYAACVLAAAAGFVFAIVLIRELRLFAG